MFHVHADKRAQRSAGKIAAALTRLIQTKPFDQVTIADLQRETGVARTTFYRNFDNLADVLEWQCDLEFDRLFSRFTGAARFPSERDALRIYLAYWTEHSAILVNLIQIQRVDIIYKYQEKYANLMLKEYGPLLNLAQAEQKYFLSVRIGFILNIILTWVKNGCRETPAQLETIAERQLEYLLTSFAAGRDAR